MNVKWGKMLKALFVCSIALSIVLSTSAGAQIGAGQGSIEKIKKLISDAGGAGDYPGSDILFVFDRMDVSVEESGLSHYRHNYLVKILTAEGALKESVLRFNYDPSSNNIEVKRVRIFRKNGTVEDIDPGEAKDLYAPASMIYWGARMKLVDLPRLFCGDAVEILTEKIGYEIAYLDEGAADMERYIPPMRGHFYDVVLFQGHAPYVEKKYTLHLPKSKSVQFKVFNGTLYSSHTFGSDEEVYSWWALDVPPVKSEPHMAALSDVVPKLVLTTVPSWKDKSRWFASIHDTIFDDNEEIRLKVKELTRGLKSDLEKVEALQHWAAQEIRYSGISMGKGEGYTIHPGIMTFHDRCGVCKDKAGMLITLMKSAGYEVYPALTMAGARVEDVPADQFNHCVVAWRHKDGSYTMLDPTWVPYSTELWSSAEQEQNYVIGTPWGEELMETPYSPPENHRLSVVSKASIDRNGSLEGKMRIEGTRYMDQRLRRYLGTHRKDDLRRFLEGWLDRVAPGAVVTACKIGNALDFGSRFSVEFTYSIPRFAIATDSTLDFVSPAWSMLFGNRYLFYSSLFAGEKERNYPLFIWFTQEIDCSETIDLPGGFKGVPSVSARKGGDFASFEVKRMQSGRVIKEKGTILIKHRTIPADGYEDFSSAVSQAKDFACRRMVVRR